MTDKNKVVIKINYKEINNTQKTNSEPKMITEWNYKRIGYALIITLTLLLMGGLYLIGIFDINESKKNSTTHPILNTKIVENKKAIKSIQKENEIKPLSENIKPSPEELNPILKKSPPVKKSILPTNKETKNTSVSKKKEMTSIISDHRVTRALLTTKINNREPAGEIILPIELRLNETTKIHYFTEIKDMKNEVVYHYWVWGNEPVFSKKIQVGGNRWRISTRKELQYSKAGDWSVRLLNKDNIILNEIKFQVVKK